MEEIGRAVRKFDHDHKRLPLTLAELVKANYLPVSATFYSCPIKYGRIIWLLSKPHTATDFEFIYNGDHIVIKMDSQLEQTFLKKIGDKSLQALRLTISEGGKGILTKKEMKHFELKLAHFARIYG